MRNAGVGPGPGPVSGAVGDAGPSTGGPRAGGYSHGNASRNTGPTGYSKQDWAAFFVVHFIMGVIIYLWVVIPFEKYKERSALAKEAEESKETEKADEADGSDQTNGSD